MRWWKMSLTALPCNRQGSLMRCIAKMGDAYLRRDPVRDQARGVRVRAVSGQRGHGRRRRGGRERRDGVGAAVLVPLALPLRVKWDMRARRG